MKPVVPLMIVNVFHGTSVPVIAQFAQNFHAGKIAQTGKLTKNFDLMNFLCPGVTFQAYDYGPRENIMRYGSTRPMEYNLDQITAPVYYYFVNFNFCFKINQPYENRPNRFTCFREEMTPLSHQW
jgi:hypothetical protein